MLQRELGTDCAPSCTLCHWTEEGGRGKVTRSFGLAMMEAGLREHDDKSLMLALTRLEATGTDSDADGTGDIQQLRVGLNPNDGTPLCAPPGECSVAAPHPGSGWMNAVVGLIAAACATLLWRRRA